MGFLVGVYQEKKDYPNAIDLAKQMVALQPHNDKYHFTLGALYDEDKQKKLSADEMRKAIAINPSNAPALNYLGYSYAEDGTNLGEAEKLIKRALVIEPEDGFYVDSLGWVYYQKGEYQKAVDQLERAVNLTNSDPTITEHLGDAYNKVGKERDARHQYEDALKTDPGRRADPASQESKLPPQLRTNNTRSIKPAAAIARRALAVGATLYALGLSACATVPRTNVPLAQAHDMSVFLADRDNVVRFDADAAVMEYTGGRTAFQGAREYYRAKTREHASRSNVGGRRRAGGGG